MKRKILNWDFNFVLLWQKQSQRVNSNSNSKERTRSIELFQASFLFDTKNNIFAQADCCNHYWDSDHYWKKNLMKPWFHLIFHLHCITWILTKIHFANPVTIQIRKHSFSRWDNFLIVIPHFCTVWFSTHLFWILLEIYLFKIFSNLQITLSDEERQSHSWIFSSWKIEVIKKWGFIWYPWNGDPNIYTKDPMTFILFVIYVQLY